MVDKWTATDTDEEEEDEEEAVKENIPVATSPTCANNAYSSTISTGECS